MPSFLAHTRRVLFPRSDADLVKFVEQRKEMNLLVSEYKRSEYLREAMETESRELKAALRYAHRMEQIRSYL